MAKRENARRLFASVGAEPARGPGNDLSANARPSDDPAPGDHEQRLARMFAALSATNEAIMRATTRADLFQWVCQAAVHGGRFNATVIALAEPNSEFLRIAAIAGP